MSFEVTPVTPEEQTRSRRRGLYPHTVTVLNATGEVDRRATYRPTVLAGVRVEERSGALASLNGSTATDGLALFIPAAVGGYVDPRAFDGTSGWTLRDDDLVAMGEVPEPKDIRIIEQTMRVYRITGIERFDDARGRLHHFEVASS